MANKTFLTYFKRTIITVFFLGLITKSSATNYYVSTSGNDTNNGTSINLAWRTINYAVNFSGLTAGDNVFILGGTYFGRAIMTKSGSIANKITVSNYNAQIVILDGTGSTPAAYNFAGLFEVRASNVIVNGLKCINARWDLTAEGISVQGPNVTNVVVQNCITNNSSSCGIGVWGNTADYSGVTNVIIQNNDISQAVVGGYQENLSISGGVDNFIVRNNTVHDSMSPPNAVNIPLGIDAKTNVRNGKIHNNIIYNMPYAGGIYVDGYDNTAYNIDIYSNIVHNVAWYGMSIGAEEGGSDYNINVYNNIFYNNLGHGISINNSNISTPNNIHDVKIYNNTVYGNGGVNGGNGICNLNTASYNIVIKNNILSQNTWSNVVLTMSANPSLPVITNNLSDGVQNAFYPGSVIALGSASVYSSPSFINAGAANFKLNSNSPAINAATATLVPLTDFDGNTRPSGGASDIGAYEFGSTLTTDEFEFVSQNDETIAMSISPNPVAKGNFLNAVFAIQDNYTIEIYDIQGKVMFKKTIINAKKESFNLDFLSSNAMYTLYVTNSNGKKVTKKLIVTN